MATDSRPKHRTYAVVFFLLFAQSCGKRPEKEPSKPEEEARSIQSDRTDTTGYRQFWKKLDNPASEGWKSEVFANRAAGVLDQLGEAILSPKSSSAIADGIFSENIHLFAPADEAFSTLTIPGQWRLKRAETTTDGSNEKWSGTREVLSRLQETFYPGESTHGRLQFEIIWVETRPDSTSLTDVRVENSDNRESGEACEQHSKWRVTWGGF